MSLTIRVRRAPPEWGDAGFVRYDWILLIALLLLVVLAVGPAWALHGGARALRNLAWIGVWVGAGLVLLLLVVWLSDPQKGETSASAWLRNATVFLLRFLLFAFLGAGLGAALAAGPGYSASVQNGASLTGGAVFGVLGNALYWRLGPTRFWPGFGRFMLALLASFMLGLLGLLVPGDWGVDAGILLPLAVFLVLAIRASFRKATDPPPVSS